MALRTLNSEGGFGITNGNIIIDSNGNVAATNLTVIGTSNLGPVSNVTITGGVNGQVLTTDGSGALSWSTSSSNSAAPMPYYIPTIESYIIPNNFQGLFFQPIEIDGEFEVDGILVDVSGAGSGGSPPGGANTQLQYNSNGNFAGSSSLTFNDVTSTLTANNLIISTSANLGDLSNVKITGGVANYVIITDGTGNLSWAEQTSGGGTSIVVDDFVGNGVQTTYPLTITPANVNQTIVNYNGVTLLRDSYTVDGANLIFDSPPANGSLIEVSIFSVSSGMPSGSNTQVQFNDSGTFAGNTGFTYNKITGVLAAPVIQTEGTNIANIPGANVTGTVANATHASTANTVVDAAQPNITSVGNLTSLVVGGNITPTANVTYDLGNNTNRFKDLYLSGNSIYLGDTTLSAAAGNFEIPGTIIAGNASLGNLATANFITGTLTTASQPNVTSLGTLSSLSVTGNISAGNANLGNLATANFVTGTLTTNAQPNVTSLGTLTSLNVSGNISSNTLTTTNRITAGNGLTITTGGITATGNIDVTGNFNVTGNINYSNVTDLVVGDPLIYIGEDNTGNLFDLGIVASYTASQYVHTGIVRNHNDGYWTFFDGVTAEPTTVIDWANASYPTVKAGNLVLTGNANVGNIGATSGVFTTVVGTLTTNAQPNITSLGTLSSLSVTGNISAGNANLGNLATANFVTGTLTTASQPNVTSVGNLSNLTVSGNTTLSGGTAGGVAYLNGSKVLTTGSALTFDGTTFTSGAHTLSTGNLSFGGTGQRITGNFDGTATSTDRVLVVNSTANTATTWTVAPNGTGNGSRLQLWATDSPIGAGASFAEFLVNSTEVRIAATPAPFGSVLPITIYTGSTERVRVDGNTGNVGIGTSSPGAKLDIQGGSILVGTTTAGNSTVGMTFGKVAAGGGTINNRITLATYGGQYGAYMEAYADLSASTATYLAFGTTAGGGGTPIERMRLDSSGSLGLGVTPSAWTSTWKSLDVTSGGSSLYGSLAIGGIGVNAYFDSGLTWRYKTSFAAGRYEIGSSGIHSWLIAPSGTAGAAITFTQAMTLDASGKLSVGTTTTIAGVTLNVVGGINSTNGALNVSGNGGFYNAANKFGVDNNNGVTRFYSSGPNSSTRGSYDFRLTDSVGSLDTSGMTLNASGNLGVGTSSPASKLHIESTSAESFQIGYSSTKRSRFGTTSTGDLQIYAYDSAVGYKNILLAMDVGTAGGNVGIGTNAPLSKLVVSNAGAAGLEFFTNYPGGGVGTYIQSYNRSASAYSSTAYDAADHSFRISGTERMKIDSSGRALIGYTTSQGSYTLQVSGNVYLSGTLTEASSIALKENVKPITNALDIVCKLEGVTYDRKDGSSYNEPGFIAEKVAEVIETLVDRDENGNPMGVKYNKTIAYLVEAIKELKSEIDLLKGVK